MGVSRDPPRSASTSTTHFVRYYLYPISNHQGVWCIAAIITWILFLSHLFFVFALSNGFFKSLRCNSRRPNFRILVFLPLFMVDFYRFIIEFPCSCTAEKPVNSSFNHSSFVLKGGAVSKS